MHYMKNNIKKKYNFNPKPQKYTTQTHPIKQLKNMQKKEEQKEVFNYFPAITLNSVYRYVCVCMLVLEILYLIFLVSTYPDLQLQQSTTCVVHQAHSEPNWRPKHSAIKSGEKDTNMILYLFFIVAYQIICNSLQHLECFVMFNWVQFVHLKW